MIFQKRSISIASISIATVLLSLLLSGLSIPTFSVGSTDPPIHVHLTWQNDTSTTMTATWQTSTSTAGDIVRYGLAPSTYTINVTGTNHTYSGASGYIHDVELTGLAPNTTYYFVCGGDTGGWSPERAFRTAPTAPIEPWMGTYVRFVMGGDSRTQPTEREKISKAMAKFNPAFVMHDGDMVSDGDTQDQWDTWYDDLHNNWIGNNSGLDNYGLTIPIIPAEGNHEEDSPKYYNQLALPGNEMYYSYNWGPDIHIIVLNSEKEETASHDAEHQAAWLESDLISHSSAMWKIAIFHRPPFVTGNHNPWQPARTWWVPLFDKYHVDLVVGGHEHSYQRSYPINWTDSQTEPQDWYSDGTTYIVSGGWGAPLYNNGTAWWQVYANKTYHFCLVEINGTSLHLQAKDNLGNTFDEITISKAPLVGARARFRYTPQRNFPYVNETVTFDASASRAGNGTHLLDIANYTWDFDDGTPLVTETDPITTHNYTTPGEYTVTLNVTALNTTDNSVIWDIESQTINVYVPSHNIVMTSVVPTSTKHGQLGTHWGGPGGGPPLTPVTVVFETWTVDIDATLKNNGTFPETFTVEAFYGNATGNYSLGIQPVTLPEFAVKTVTFTWDVPEIPKAYPYRTYIMYANASVVPDENETADNYKVSPVEVTVRWLGDATGDGKVNIYDLTRLALAWKKPKTHAYYNPECDFAKGDGEVNIYDLTKLAIWWKKGPVPG